MTITEKQHHFQQEYYSLFRYVYQYLGLRLSNQTDKEDVVCQIMVEAYEHLADFDPTLGSLRQWLSGIMKHRLIDFWRKQKVVVDLAEAEQVVSQFSLENLSTTLDQQLLVEKIMAHLSPPTRTLFYMHYVDGLTYEEMASVTEKSASAIRKLFSRTQQELEHQFAKYR